MAALARAMARQVARSRRRSRAGVAASRDLLTLHQAVGVIGWYRSLACRTRCRCRAGVEYP